MTLAPNWMSLLIGSEVLKHPLPKKPEEIPKWRELIDFSAVNSPLPDGVDFIRESYEGGRGRTMSAEIYRPTAPGRYPVLLYLHGGGWCVGSASSVRRVAMLLAAEGRVVINAEYSLAPEFPWPAAVEDVLASAWWSYNQGAKYGGDGGKMMIAGDSAGGNLAAVVLAAATDADVMDKQGIEVPEGNTPEFSAALFNYGVFDFPLLMQRPGGYFGSIEVRYNLAYLGTDFLSKHWSPLVSPIYAPRLDRFPRSYFCCGTADGLLEQSLAMSAALARANVAVQLSTIAGLDHGFLQLESYEPEAAMELTRINKWLPSAKPSF